MSFVIGGNRVKLMHKLLMAGALALPLALAQTQTQAADVKIGFVSIAKILNSAPQAESASKRLEQGVRAAQKGSG
jgi:outer membrane protein